MAEAALDNPYADIDVEFGIHMVFSTIPNRDKIEFEEDTERYYFEKFRIGAYEKEKHLYKPFKYYLLGDYDVCYISLINDFKFAHRLFEPISERDKAYEAHTFHSYTGFALNSSDNLMKLFGAEQQPEYYFMGVINLKLNNGLLIGNGLKFIERVTAYLSKNICETGKFILTQTLSWFELSLMVFMDDPGELSDIVSKLRRLEFEDLQDGTLYEDSLYFKILTEEDRKKINRTSVFSDTHTYFGFHSSLITENDDEAKRNKFHKRFLDNINNINLTTDIEWQIKPGHMQGFREILNKHFKEEFKEESREVILGKSDYIIEKISDNIAANYKLLRMLRKENCDFFLHARKVRTYVYLTIEKGEKASKTDKNTLDWSRQLEVMAIKPAKFNIIDKQLRALKVSRQVRLKTLKTFSSYNTGIMDPILFPFFIDFTIFIDNLMLMIGEEYDKLDKHSFRIQVIEDKLNRNIKLFQDAYNVRFLNGYQFENISSFDLDFNSSIQLLLTSYGTLVYEYAKLFYGDPDQLGDESPKSNEKKKAIFYAIIQLDNIDSVSNYYSIKYFVHHLTSPEFVFATITKEILNYIKEDSDHLKEILKGYNKGIKLLSEFVDSSYFDDMIRSGLVDPYYFVIDGLRYKSTFEGKLELFNYWFWIYNFQNSSLFDSTGMFNEQQFRMELFRICLIKNIYEDKFKLECPIPELYTYWDRHYDTINHITTQIVLYSKRKKKELVVSIRKNNKDVKPLSAQYVFPNLRDFIDEFVSGTTGHLPFFSELERIIHNTLINNYKNSNKKITMLKRNWHDGILLKKHMQVYDDIPFAVDQTGGVFFPNTEKTRNYFKTNAVCLLNIIDFGYKKKSNFIASRIKIK